MLPSLGHRPAATSLIRSLAWELPHAAGAALKTHTHTHTHTHRVKRGIQRRGQVIPLLGSCHLLLLPFRGDTKAGLSLLVDATQLHTTLLLAEAEADLTMLSLFRLSKNPHTGEFLLWRSGNESA